MDAFFEQAFDLSGQVALVTGGGSGLGYATAKCLAAAGAKVVITGRREEVLAKACQELGDRVCYYVHDVTDTDAAPTFIARVVDEQGGCDILVNNAGRHCKKPVEEITMQDFRDVMDVHLYVCFVAGGDSLHARQEARQHPLHFVDVRAARDDPGLCLRVCEIRTDGPDPLHGRRCFR